MTESLIYLALAILAGFLFSYLARLIRLPNVTGYLVAGLLLGVSGLIPKGTLADFDIISDVALGFIAFSIGSEFKLSYLKEVGIGPIIITFTESLGAVVVVTGALLLFGFPAPLSILLGAISAATAPAATLMVVKQYKADGPVTRMLLPVVAMDDAVTLMAFSVAAAVAQVLIGGSLSVGAMILQPVIEIFGSLLLGTALGFAASFLLKLLKDKGDLTCLAVAMCFAGAGLSTLGGFSALLVCMMMGAVCVNLTDRSSELLRRTDKITPPIFMLFFVISGAELDVSVLASVGVIGIVYVIARVLGKMGGTWLGAVIAKSDKHVKNYMGYMLLPQAGVAIGLSLLAMQAVPEYGAQIRAVVLCATFFYELVGPPLTKIALKASGEIKEEPRKKAKSA